MPKRRNKQFSYCTGERGRNRVRAFRHSANGKLYLEFRVEGKRHSTRLDTSDEEEAKKLADELSVSFGRLADEEAEADQVSVRTLIDRYGREMSPTKGRSKQDHDRRTGPRPLKTGEGAGSADAQREYPSATSVGPLVSAGPGEETFRLAQD